MRREFRLRLASRTKGCVVKNVEVFTHRPWRICRYDCAILPVFRVAGVLLLDIREDQIGVDGEAFATNKALFYAARNGCLENTAQQVTLAETAPLGRLLCNRLPGNAWRFFEKVE